MVVLVSPKGADSTVKSDGRPGEGTRTVRAERGDAPSQAPPMCDVLATPNCCSTCSASTVAPEDLASANGRVEPVADRECTMSRHSTSSTRRSAGRSRLRRRRQPDCAARSDRPGLLRGLGRRTGRCRRPACGPRSRGCGRTGETRPNQSQAGTRPLGSRTDTVIASSARRGSTPIDHDDGLARRTVLDRVRDEVAQDLRHISLVATDGGQIPDWPRPPNLTARAIGAVPLSTSTACKPLEQDGFGSGVRDAALQPSDREQVFDEAIESFGLGGDVADDRRAGGRRHLMVQDRWAPAVDRGDGRPQFILKTDPQEGLLEGPRRRGRRSDPPRTKRPR